MQDLSHPFVDDLQTYPADRDVHVSAGASYDKDGYRTTDIESGSHAGTHIDAPAHIFPDGTTLTEFTVEEFVFEAHKIDCRDLGAREPIQADRIPADEGADCVIFQTGWDKYWGTDRYLDHPYLSPEAARRCAEHGFAIGSDTLNPDPTPTLNATTGEPDGFPAHETLLAEDCLIIENLTNLDTVPDRFELRAYPLPLQVDGAPVRAVGAEL